KHTRHPSVVPSGRASPAGCFPALKRRAILKISLRDKGIGWSAFPARKQPVYERWLQGDFAASVAATTSWETMTPTFLTLLRKRAFGSGVPAEPGLMPSLMASFA